jgi:pantoate--beta-alanine ligase
MREARRTLSEPVGLVPTMGCLHAGHVSLVRRALRDNASVVASIFVNPSQFGPGEDYERYPRREMQDLALLEEEGVTAAFIPAPADMYPDGFSTWVEVEGLTAKLEGEARPGHFRGVTTVCNKLFNVLRPQVAYFGQKDAQQAVVIRKMVKDLNMNLEITVLPTLREADGLAMSSRNMYLNPDERRAAVVLYRALCLAQDRWKAGCTDAAEMLSEMRRLVESEPLAGIDYISIDDARNLETLAIIRAPALVSLAVRVGKTRLIDNVILE